MHSCEDFVAFEVFHFSGSSKTVPQLTPQGYGASEEPEAASEKRSSPNTNAPFTTSSIAQPQTLPVSSPDPTSRNSATAAQDEESAVTMEAREARSSDLQGSILSSIGFTLIVLSVCVALASFFVKKMINSRNIAKLETEGSAVTVASSDAGSLAVGSGDQTNADGDQDSPPVPPTAASASQSK